MAEVVLGPIADQLITMLTNKLFGEASLVIDFKDDFRFLCDEIVLLSVFLKDAPDKSGSSNSVCNLRDRLDDVLHEAVDLMEECEGKRCTNILFRCRTGRRIRNLKQKIAKINRDAKRLTHLRGGFEMNSQIRAAGANDNSNIQEKRKRSSVLENESRTVGMQESISKLSGWVLSEDDEYRVIAVVGVGGSGKTLLLQHVFKNIKDKFVSSFWLSVSQSYSVRSLQRDIIGKLGLSGLNDVTEQTAGEAIHEALSGKRSLVVLDDIWTTEDDLRRRIGLTNLITCKILISTRNMEVYRNMEVRESSVHHMDLLSEKDSWTLFCIYAFPDFTNNEAPQELEKLARDIERKCGRLPLAVKTVAASLAKRPGRPSVWEDTLRRLPDLLISKDVMPTLQLSYDALPAHLKPCFLYCSVFPEDHLIDTEYLIHLWIAEGFVQSNRTEDALDQGLRYLNDLLDRCLIEVPNELYYETGGRTSHCKMHDLLRDLALLQSEKYDKCMFRKQMEEESFKGRRRLCLTGWNLQTIPKDTRGWEALRTLFINNGSFSHLDAGFERNLQSLRVLDLSGTSIESLPESIGTLKHLRLLNVHDTLITDLPKSVSYLKNLQFLAVSDQKFEAMMLPQGIGELKCLRYLSCFSGGMGYPLRGWTPTLKEISKLKALQTLKLHLEIRLREENEEIDDEDVGNVLRLDWLRGLTQLRNLFIRIDPTGIQSGRRYSGSAATAEKVFGDMVKMRYLTLINNNNISLDRYVDLPKDMINMKRLEYLHICNYSLPEWITSFQNLMFLRIGGWSDECPGLETVPNLRFLVLEGYERHTRTRLSEGFGKRGSFEKLEMLCLGGLSHLEELRVENGAMPSLKFLGLDDCPAMPQGLELLGSLRELWIFQCGQWVNRLQKGEKNRQNIGAHVKIFFEPWPDHYSYMGPNSNFLSNI